MHRCTMLFDDDDDEANRAKRLWAHNCQNEEVDSGAAIKIIG